jgi:hypothetical protein
MTDPVHPKAPVEPPFDRLRVERAIATLKADPAFRDDEWGRDMLRNTARAWRDACAVTGATTGTTLATFRDNLAAALIAAAEQR